MARFAGVNVATPPATSSPSPTMPEDQGQVNAMDRQFVNKASGANLEEVALGNLALQKAQSGSVKAFAQRMVTDHGKSQQELINAAQEADLEAPMDLPPEAKAVMQRLEKLSGMAFDREYMKVMVKGHEKAVKLFQMEVDKGMHPAVTGYAQKTLPVIQEHLEQAQSILSQLQ
jgi:putative membrane protein